MFCSSDLQRCMGMAPIQSTHLPATLYPGRSLDWVQVNIHILCTWMLGREGFVYISNQVFSGHRLYRQESRMAQNVGRGTRQEWVQILALPLMVLTCSFVKWA